jgi:hypothetical protein
MSLITQIVSEEKIRIEKMIADYEQELLALPKGTLVSKTVKNNQYYYLQFREGKKTVSSYIGGDANIANDLRERINRRKHIEAMLKILRGEYFQAKKLTGE